MFARSTACLFSPARNVRFRRPDCACRTDGWRLVEERRWISRQDYVEGLAFSQLSPGPLAAQLAMYIGWVRAGRIGAALVAAAFIAPSFLMAVAIATALSPAVWCGS